MSGPIIRKYGFPNHEQIFGRRPLEHGAEESKQDDAAQADAKEAPKGEKSTPPKSESRRD
ncbi:hypothetical protein [Paludisphaera rhizosphaerae]|uniref:hypothetical protein n=1 Tax=Paludisphaera rhizosphaerae TaxID=2711216 RepID=UPI0013EB66EE|nr:hypothetical protein [Paludisphaera rhizosphaerae]